MTKESSPVWALRGVRPTTRRLFKQFSALTGENVGELADRALRDFAEKGLAEAYGDEAVKEAAKKAEEGHHKMEPS